MLLIVKYSLKIFCQLYNFIADRIPIPTIYLMLTSFSFLSTENLNIYKKITYNMNFMNSSANIKQFQLIKFMNENCEDDHLISKISIVLRRDKIEAPYYMNTKIRLSSCIDRQDNGLIHAMEILSHNRMYNLTEDKFNEIKSLIIDASPSNDESDQVKIIKDEKKLKIVLTSRNDDEFKNLFKDYHELFDKIDNTIV
jgi:hypothetical protein